MSRRTRIIMVCLASLSLGATALHVSAHHLSSHAVVHAKPVSRDIPLDLAQGEAPALAPEYSSQPDLRDATEVFPEIVDTLVQSIESTFSQHTTQSNPQTIHVKERLHDAVELAKAAANGDEAAQAAVHDRLAHEPDPRIRSALTTGNIPVIGEDLPNALQLPVPTAVAEPGIHEGFWQYHDDACSSTITVDANGRATVETIQHSPTLGENPSYHVRYEAWAWRDSVGNLIIDGRGQRVDDLLRPGQSSESWSPDSMTVTPTGLIDTIDDRRSTGLGSTGVSAVN